MLPISGSVIKINSNINNNLKVNHNPSSLKVATMMLTMKTSKMMMVRRMRTKRRTISTKILMMRMR